MFVDDMEGFEMSSMEKMGEGTIYLMISYTILLGCGYIIHFGLGRIFGPEKYGIFGVILSLLTIIEIFLMKGFKDAVSKYVSEFSSRANVIKNKAIKIELILSSLAFCLYFISAKYIAILLKDQNLTNYIRLSAVIIPIMSIYYIYIGYLSGKKEFRKYAIAMGTRQIVKTFIVFLLVLLGFELYGAIIGYIIGVAIGLTIAGYFSIDETKESNNFSSRKLINFAIPLVLFSGMTTLLMNLDLLFVKALIENTEQIGIYTSALTITRAPYYIFFALSITLLPSISKSTSTNNLPQTQEYISKSLRYLLLLILPLAFFVSGSAGEVIKLTYSSVYISAANPLSILIFGITFITIFYVLATIITGSGNPGVSMAMALSLVPIDVGLNLLLIPEYGLEGAATATTITCLIGLIISAICVKKKFGMLMSGKSFSKILVGSVVLFIIPQFFIVSGLLFIVYAIGMFGVYFLILLALKEINEDDKEFVSRMLPDSISNRFFNRNQQ